MLRYLAVVKLSLIKVCQTSSEEVDTVISAVDRNRSEDNSGRNYCITVDFYFALKNIGSSMASRHVPKRLGGLAVLTSRWGTRLRCSQIAGSKHDVAVFRWDIQFVAGAIETIFNNCFQVSSSSQCTSICLCLLGLCQIIGLVFLVFLIRVHALLRRLGNGLTSE